MDQTAGKARASMGAAAQGEMDGRVEGYVSLWTILDIHRPKDERQGVDDDVGGGVPVQVHVQAKFYFFYTTDLESLFILPPDVHFM